MLHRPDEINHNNPIYSAGFTEGQKFERELLQAERAELLKIQADRENNRSHMRINVNALELDIFKDLVVCTKNLADYVAEHNKDNPSPEALDLLISLDRLLNKYEQRTIENDKKLESQGVKVLRS